MAHHSAEPRPSVHPHSRRDRILDNDTLIADTRDAIELHERGYPHRPELPKELQRVSVDMSKLPVASNVSYYPLNDGSICFSLPYLGDVARSHEQPIGEMKAISTRLAFDAHKVKALVEVGPLSTQSGRAGKGNMRGYYCYIAASIQIHSKISRL